MLGKKRPPDENKLNPLGWMVTFSDLITLLLTFFVLLISMSSMDVKAMQQTFGTFSGGSGVLNFSESNRLAELGQILEKMEELPTSDAAMQEELKDLVFDFENLEYQKLMELVSKDISILRDKRGLVIQLADYILFNEGGSELRPEFLPILNRVAAVLRMTQKPLSVEGHTDASLLEGGDGAWAWELSLDRAIAVTEYLTETEGLLPERFRVGGFGPSRPLVDNDTPKNRAKNRRIEIIIYKEKFG